MPAAALVCIQGCRQLGAQSPSPVARAAAQHGRAAQAPPAPAHGVWAAAPWAVHGHHQPAQHPALPPATAHQVAHEYLACLKQHKATAASCQALSRKYLECRMER